MILVRMSSGFCALSGIANSLSQSANKKAKSAQGGLCETFGAYVCETVQDLEHVTRNIAQHNITNILFQAQMGTLTQNTMHSMLSPEPPPLLPAQQSKPFSNQQHQMMMPHQMTLYPSDWSTQGQSPTCNRFD